MAVKKIGILKKQTPQFRNLVFLGPVLSPCWGLLTYVIFYRLPFTNMYVQLEKPTLKALYREGLQTLSHSVKTVSLSGDTFNASHIPYLCPCFDPHNATIRLFLHISGFFPQLKWSCWRVYIKHLPFMIKIMDIFIHSCSVVLEEWVISKVLLEILKNTAIRTYLLFSTKRF